MVSVVNPGKSIRNTLQYNEHKLNQGKATLIHSSGFGKDTEHLGFTDKLGHLQKIAARNEQTTVNSVHISLNFDPSENLSKDTLRQIADTYMRKIGFEGQPFLVYQHHDAGHPHIHIVTTNIRPDATRIKLHNIGRNQSEQARKSIEKEFNLVRADDKQRRQVYDLKPVDVQKVQYGRTETKRAITNVLDNILPAYKYSSLPELNAVLRSYNIVADQGSKESRIAKANGLIYRVLNDQGQKVGVPIKASDLYNKPTLKKLQGRFLENEIAKQPHKTRIKNAVDLALIRKPDLSVTGLSDTLKKENIQLVLRQNPDGIIYGLTYIDHKNKTVFNGSALGKPYSANQILQRCNHIPLVPGEEIKNNQSHQQTPLPNNRPPVPGKTPKTPPAPTHKPISNPDASMITPSKGDGLLKEIAAELFDPQYEGGPAAELRDERKRKRKRKPRL